MATVSFKIFPPFPRALASMATQKAIRGECMWRRHVGSWEEMPGEVVFRAGRVQVPRHRKLY